MPKNLQNQLTFSSPISSSMKDHSVADALAAVQGSLEFGL
jgi:hypothetical protein